MEVSELHQLTQILMEMASYIDTLSNQRMAFAYECHEAIHELAPETNYKADFLLYYNVRISAEEQNVALEMSSLAKLVSEQINSPEQSQNLQTLHTIIQKVRVLIEKRIALAENEIENQNLIIKNWNTIEYLMIEDAERNYHRSEKVLLEGAGEYTTDLNFHLSPEAKEKFILHPSNPPIETPGILSPDPSTGVYERPIYHDTINLPPSKLKDESIYNRAKRKKSKHHHHHHSAVKLEKKLEEEFHETESLPQDRKESPISKIGEAYIPSVAVVRRVISRRRVQRVK